MDDALKELLTLGRTCFQGKQYVRAEGYLSKVVEMSGGGAFADVYNMLGVVYHDQGQYERAQRAFEAALKINPAYTEASLNLAIVYNDMGRYPEASAVYQSAMQRGGGGAGELDRFVRGKIANMYADIGDVFVSCGRPDDAVGEYQRALALCPGFADIRTRLATALREKGDKYAALREFDQALAEAPHHLPARIGRGVALFSLGRVPEAIAEWEEVLARSPGNKTAQMYLSMVKGSTQRPGGGAGS